MRGIARGLGEAEVAEGLRGQQSSARRALDETFLDQERLDDLLDGVARLGQRRGDGFDSDRAAAVVLRNIDEVAPIHCIEAGGIDFELEEGAVGGGAVDRGRARDQRKVAHPAQQPPGDPRRAAGAARDLVGAVGGHADAEDPRAAIDDLLELAKFTLVGATTRAGLLTNPLRDRFGIPVRLDFYNEGELEQIVTRGARVLGVAITKDGANEIARRSRGTPRIAGRLLRRLRDFADVAGDKSIDRAVADKALGALEVDAAGLDAMDRRYLSVIALNYGGGPVGVETIAAALSEPRDAIEDIIEPFLIQKGFVQRTPRGRLLTGHAFRHLGLAEPARDPGQFGLFSSDED